MTNTTPCNLRSSASFFMFFVPRPAWCAPPLNCPTIAFICARHHFFLTKSYLNTIWSRINYVIFSVSFLSRDLVQLFNQLANKFSKQTFILLVLFFQTPLWKEMDTSKERINKRHSKQFCLYPCLPAFRLPYFVQSQIPCLYLLCLSTQPISCWYFSMMCGRALML